MKTFMKIKTVITFSLAFILMNNACTKNFDDIIPKNEITEDIVNVNLLLTHVQVLSVVRGIANKSSLIVIVIMRLCPGLGEQMADLSGYGGMPIRMLLMNILVKWNGCLIHGLKINSVFKEAM